MSVAQPPVKIEVDRVAYLHLLVRANVTDPEQWPAGYEQGAELLCAIRDYESRCAKFPDGRLDWDSSPPELENEYESLCAQLTELIEPYDQRESVSAEEVFAELGLDPAIRFQA